MRSKAVKLAAFASTVGFLAQGQGAAQKLEPGKKLERAQSAQIAAQFRRDGWAPAGSAPPDFQAALLQPEALLANPVRARAILASVAIGKKDVTGIGQVARRTADASLKESAIWSIGRVMGDAAQTELVSLYRTLPDPAVKKIILRTLRPERENDPASTLLFQEAGSPALDSSERTAIVRSLTAMSLRRFGKQAAAAPTAITSRLPASLRGQFADSYRLSRGGATSSTPLALKQIFPGRLTPQSIQAFLDRIRARRETPHTELRKVDGEGNVVAAPSSQLSQPGKFRQVLIVPAGYTSSEHDKYFTDVEKMISNMGNLEEPVYTRKYRDRLIYVVRWMPGGALGSANVNFGAKTYPHPTRPGEKGLTLKNPRVTDAVRALKQSELPTLDPIGVMVLYNLDEEAVAYASPPTLLRQKFGIARISRFDIDEHHTRPMHELAHGALNFLDEYIEPALIGQDIRDFDLLTPAILPDASWGSLRDAWESLIGNYEIRFSDILADNGSGNISTRKFPATVTTNVPGYTPFQYEFEGGMFFEFGTFHDSGNNVMNVNRTTAASPLKPNGDRFARDHSPSQKSVLDHVFGVTGTPRPNDRIRNAGPTIEWLPQLGSSVRLLIFDADKNHRWHPTTKYEVEVGWYEWVYTGTLFDPFKGEFQWRSMKREVTPTARTVDLSKTFAAGGAGILRDALVAAGVQELGDGGFNLAAMTVNDLLDQSIPSVIWPMPYQDVQVTLSTPNIYYWRFRTHNGAHWSARTEFSAFSKI